MMKLSRLLRFGRSSGKSSNGKDALGLHALTFQAGFSTARQSYAMNGNLTDRIWAPFSIYKGKAALFAEPVVPTFSKLDSGVLKVGRRGSLMLTFMPAIGERKYDSEKKQRFALSATEVGSLISLGPKDFAEFFHDPSMLSSNAGQVRKSLSIKPPPDGVGYFMSLSVVNNNLKTNERFTIHLTVAEFTVLKTACSFALPHIMGWDRLTKLPKTMVGSPSKANSQMPNLEWEK